MKKTAVEWLSEQITTAKWKMSDVTDRNAIIQQAKAMEKEQIIKARINGDVNGACIFKIAREKAEQYYNETFKSENIVMFMTPENGEIESIILTNNPDCGVIGITFKPE